MAAAKELLLLVCDVGRTMCEGDRYKKLTALKAVQQVLQQKMMFSKKDEVDVIFVGSPDTENAVFQEGSEEYTHIVDLQQSFQKPSVQLLRSLEKEKAHVHDTVGDPLEALIVAVSAFSSTATYKPGSGRILFVSDFCSPSALAAAEHEETIGGILDQMQRLQIRLEVIAVEEQLPAAAAAAASSAAAAAADDEDDEVVKPSKAKAKGKAKAAASGAAPSAPHQPTVAVLGRLVEGTGGVLITARHAMSVLAGLRARAVNTVTKLRADLSIGGVVRIPVWTYAHTAEMKQPSLKRISREAALRQMDSGSGGGGGGAGAGAEYGGGEDEDGGAGAGAGAGGSDTGVKYDRKYKLMPVEAAAAEAEAETGGAGGGILGSGVHDGFGGHSGGGAGAASGSAAAAAAAEGDVDKSELVKAFRYGRDLVIVSEAEEKTLLKHETVKELSVLGFTQLRGIARWAYMGAADVVVPAQDKDTAVGGAALSALVRAMHNQQVGALCRYVKRANSAPMLALAVPALAAGSADGVEDDEEEGGGGGSSAASSAFTSQLRTGRHSAAAHPVDTSGPHGLSAASGPLLPGQYEGPAYEHPLPVRSYVGFDCLYLVPLPFQEDVRTYHFTPSFAVDAKSAPTPAQLSAVDGLIDAMDLSNLRMDAHGQATEALLPETTFNPALQRFYQAVQARMLDPRAELPPLDPQIEAYLRPEQLLDKSARSAADAVAAAFPLQLKRGSDLLGPDQRLREDLAAASRAAAGIGKAGSKRGRSEQEREDGASASASAAAAETGKGGAGGKAGTGSKGGGEEEGEGDPSVAAGPASKRSRKGKGDDLEALMGGGTGSGGSGGPVGTIGTARPVDDFQALLAKRTPDARTAAFTQMRALVERLSRDAVTVDKAVDCLSALRVGALAEYEEQQYNDFLHRIKAAHAPHAPGVGKAGTPFWQRLVRAHSSANSSSSGGKAVGLVTHDEAPNVAEHVTPQAADAFFKQDTATRHMAAAPVAAPPAVAAAVDEMDELE